jgi:hypothetical protein
VAQAHSDELLREKTDQQGWIHFAQLMIHRLTSSAIKSIHDRLTDLISSPQIEAGCCSQLESARRSTSRIS